MSIQTHDSYLDNMTKIDGSNSLSSTNQDHLIYALKLVSTCHNFSKTKMLEKIIEAKTQPQIQAVSSLQIGNKARPGLVTAYTYAN